MNETFGEYIRKLREKKKLPLRKVAAALDIDTSILSKIERNEREAVKDMIPILADSLEYPEKEIEIIFIKTQIIEKYGSLKHLKEGLNEIIKTI
ncbi:MAG: helix-turn-helix domain-containing protein [Bacteroidota bacterium]